jgi:DNA replication protein DnaC
MFFSGPVRLSSQLRAIMTVFSSQPETSGSFACVFRRYRPPSQSYLACAPGNKACSEGQRTLYTLLSRLLLDLHIARDDGRYGEVVAGLARMELHIIDDCCGQAPLDNHGGRNILEILDDCQRSPLDDYPQLSVSGWHELIGDTAFVDAILDRLVHHSHKIELNGESIRKTLKSLTPSSHSGK